jgi:hypothetical protein
VRTRSHPETGSGPDLAGQKYSIRAAQPPQDCPIPLAVLGRVFGVGNQVLRPDAHPFRPSGVVPEPLQPPRPAPMLETNRASARTKR